MLGHFNKYPDAFTMAESARLIATFSSTLMMGKLLLGENTKETLLPKSASSDVTNKLNVFKLYTDDGLTNSDNKL